MHWPIEPDKDVQRLLGHLSDAYERTRAYTHRDRPSALLLARVCSQASKQPLDPGRRRRICMHADAGPSL
jgi:hypothetical protein